MTYYLIGMFFAADLLTTIYLVRPKLAPRWDGVYGPIGLVYTLLEK